jgi:hypothetical protein
VTESIAELAASRKITRLCHLTPVRNLLHIARDGALRSTADLSADERAAFDQQDLRRLDGYPDHICCSIEYPNVWYLRRKIRDATALQRLFPGWVCLLIDPAYLWAEGTLLCRRNAAASSGTYVDSGADVFAGMYAERVYGANGWNERDDKPASCPTDDQAEVLIPKRIPLGHANHVVVASEIEARRIYAGLELISAPVQELVWTVAPEFFDRALSGTLRSGNLPLETAWNTEVMHGNG